MVHCSVNESGTKTVMVKIYQPFSKALEEPMKTMFNDSKIQFPSGLQYQSKSKLVLENGPYEEAKVRTRENFTCGAKNCEICVNQR